jgi:hypothetical protein
MAVAAIRCPLRRSMSQIDPKLKDLLVREAHLRLSREQLTPVWTQKEAELRAIQAARPAFLPIFSKRKREEYETQLAAVQQVVDVLRKGLEVLDRVEPHVKKLIEEEIENILRADHPEYVQALAALRQKEDWVRCLGRFAGKIHDFARELGNVRNLACSGYARQANTYSQGAGQAFQLAVEAAQKVEEEVTFANKVADAQSRMFVANGFTSRPLPRLQPTGFAAWVSRISTLPLAEAQVQFDLLFEQTKKLYETGLPELRGHADSIEELQSGEVHSSLRAMWEQFRAEVAPEIFAGDTERSVADTERLLLAKAGSTTPVPR